MNSTVQPFVSVIVIGYNQQDFAPITVRSVLDQDFKNFECIFVDDGSSDETFARVKEVEKTDSRLKAFRKENGGPSSARNYGAAQVRKDTDFICYLDGDDIYFPGYLSFCVAYLEAHPDVGVVLPSFKFIGQDGALLPEQRRGYRWVPGFLGLPRRLRDSEPETKFVTFYCGAGGACFWMARSEFFRRTLGWNEYLWQFEDTEMLCQLTSVTKVHVVPDRLYGYRMHSGQATVVGAAVRDRQARTLEALQEIWNKRHSADPEKYREVGWACFYYRQVHLPFRHLWVARRAFMDFVRAPSRQTASWLCTLGWMFVRDLIYFKIFPWRSTTRYPTTRFSEEPK